MCDLAQEGEDESNLGDGACRGDESACCDGRRRYKSGMIVVKGWVKIDGDYLFS